MILIDCDKECGQVISLTRSGHLCREPNFLQFFQTKEIIAAQGCDLYYCSSVTDGGDK